MIKHSYLHLLNDVCWSSYIQCQILGFGRCKTFLTLYLADDVGVVEDPVDLSVQEFGTKKTKPKQPK